MERLLVLVLTEVDMERIRRIIATEADVNNAAGAVSWALAHADVSASSSPPRQRASGGTPIRIGEPFFISHDWQTLMKEPEPGPSKEPKWLELGGAEFSTFGKSVVMDTQTLRYMAGDETIRFWHD